MTLYIKQSYDNRIAQLSDHTVLYKLSMKILLSVALHVNRTFEA